jgi:hypothetical protein
MLRSSECAKAAVVLFAALLVSSAPARAACCRVVKIDAEVPTQNLRVCEPDAAGRCGSVLFSGPLALGASADVCTEAGIVVYEEWDPSLAAFGPATTAVCEDGGDVEL